MKFTVPIYSRLLISIYHSIIIFFVSGMSIFKLKTFIDEASASEYYFISKIPSTALLAHIPPLPSD